MPTYEILFLTARGEPSVHYWPCCRRAAEAREIARKYVQSRFVAAEVWQDSERLAVVIAEDRLTKPSQIGRTAPRAINP